jgi:hypothetical protein
LLAPQEDVSMVQSSEQWLGNDAPNCLLVRKVLKVRAHIKTVN